MSSYCSTDDARSAGATGTEAEIVQAILDASDRVDRYTGELFTPTARTFDLTVGGDGVVRVRRRIQSITSVTWAGAPDPMIPSAYVVSSSKAGGRDTISLYGDLSWADVTVLGAEPWNGGWANLSSRGRDPRVIVVGVFGWDAPPYDVRQATALIASGIRSDDVLTDAATDSGTVADTEGNVVPVAPPFTDAGTTQQAVQNAVEQLARVRSRTTGALAADTLLATYVREPVRMRA